MSGSGAASAAARAFEDSERACVYQEKTSDGAQSRLNKLVRRDS